METPRNAFKSGLLRGETQLGFWSSLCSPVAVEVLRDAGFDWILIDMEHAANETPDVVQNLRALTGGTATPVVRPPWNDAVVIKRLLDAGAQALLVPFVQTPDEARSAVAAVRYPPNGVRGVAVATRANRFGRAKAYFREADAEICLLLQLETRAALGHIDEIAGIDGVDGLFIGPSDLAADMGRLGDPVHPEVQAAIADACARIRKAGKPAGVLAGSPAQVSGYLGMGFDFVAIGSDLGCLRDAAEAMLGDARRIVAQV